MSSSAPSVQPPVDATDPMRPENSGLLDRSLDRLASWLLPRRRRLPRERWRYRERVFASMLFLTLVVPPIYLAIYIREGQPRFAMLLGSYVLLMGGLALWVRVRGRIGIGHHILVGASLALLVAKLTGSLGILSSSLIWLPLIPAMGMLLSGRRAALIWSVLCVLVVLVFAWTHPVSPTSLARSLRSFDLLLHGLNIIGMIVVGPFVVGISQRLWTTARSDLEEVNRQLRREARERFEAEQARRESESLYEVLVELSPEAVAVHCNGVLRYCNRKAVELLGAQSGEDLLGRQILEFVHEEDHAEVRERIDTAMRSGEVAPFNDVRLVDLEGRLLQTEVSGGPIQYHGDRGMQVIIRDVGPRKRTEEALRRSARELEERNAELLRARDAALQATELKSQFLANMSHEIRTPLSAVLGMAHLLLETELDHEQQEYAETIDSSGEALLQLINDILDLSKVEAGRFDLEMIEYEVTEVLDEAERLLRPRAIAKGLRFTVGCEGEPPGTQRGDPHRVRQILLNLISNAIKFTDAGEVAVRLSCVEGRGRRWLRYEVRDTGIGIGLEVQEQLFESFTQADGSTTRRYGGTGLGLSIARRLVQMMGGRFGLESEPEQGSCFWFELPEAEGPEPVEQACITDGEPLRGRSVLLCVGDPSLRREVEGAFREGGALVQSEAGPESASLWLHEASWDVIILDLDLIGASPAGAHLERALEQRKGQDESLLLGIEGRLPTTSSGKNSLAVDVRIVDPRAAGDIVGRVKDHLDRVIHEGSIA